MSQAVAAAGNERRRDGGAVPSAQPLRMVGAGRCGSDPGGARARASTSGRPEGKRYIDFNSQLMCVNAGHGASRHHQGDPGSGGRAGLFEPVHGDRSPRAPWRQAGGDHPRRHGRLLLHQRRRRVPTRTPSASRALVTGRHKILARYRVVPRWHRRQPSRSPATRGAGRPNPAFPASFTCSTRITGCSAAGTRPRRRLRLSRGGHRCSRARNTSRPSSSRRSAAPTASSCRPTATLQGVRALCDKHGILMICDEVMAGFGRTGKWFGVDHWNVVPDLMTMAKGLTSAYVPLGAVGMRRAYRRSLPGEGVQRRPHLQQPSARLRHGAGHHQGLRRRRAWSKTPRRWGR